MASHKNQKKRHNTNKTNKDKENQSGGQVRVGREEAGSRRRTEWLIQGQVEIKKVKEKEKKMWENKMHHCYWQVVIRTTTEGKDKVKIENSNASRYSRMPPGRRIDMKRRDKARRTEVICVQISHCCWEDQSMDIVPFFPSERLPDLCLHFSLPHSPSPSHMEHVSTDAYYFFPAAVDSPSMGSLASVYPSWLLSSHLPCCWCLK